MPRILGLSEIIIYVSDMAAQVGFYRDVLGFSIVYPRDLVSLEEAHHP